MGSVGWNRTFRSSNRRCLGRSPHGERGLEFFRCDLWLGLICRSPHGERGLECISLYYNLQRITSLPALGAWVGIELVIFASTSTPVAPRMGSVGWNYCSLLCLTRGSSRSPHGERGLESLRCSPFLKDQSSLPAWGAWVGIRLYRMDIIKISVAPRMGSVGWNMREALRHHRHPRRSPHGERGLE